MSISTVTQQTMLSTEIVKIINDMREEGAAILEHKNFMAKVVKVLGADLAAKFSAVRIDSRGKEQPCYALPKREANLMVMSESYKVQAAVYDRMVELEQKAVEQPKPLSQLEVLQQSIVILTEHDKRIAANESEVKQIAAKVESISIDLRNGVPRGFVSRANAYKIYSVGFSKDIFELVLDKYNVPTQKYVHQAEGHSTVTFGYQEDRIATAVAHFVRHCEQVTPKQCYSELLNKKFYFIKPVPYGLKEKKAA